MKTPSSPPQSTGRILLGYIAVSWLSQIWLNRRFSRTLCSSRPHYPTCFMRSMLKKVPVFISGPHSLFWWGAGKHPDLTPTRDAVTSDARVRARGPAICCPPNPWFEFIDDFDQQIWLTCFRPINLIFLNQWLANQNECNFMILRNILLWFHLRNIDLPHRISELMVRKWCKIESSPSTLPNYI